MYRYQRRALNGRNPSTVNAVMSAVIYVLRGAFHTPVPERDAAEQGIGHIDENKAEERACIAHAVLRYVYMNGISYVLLEIKLY